MPSALGLVLPSVPLLPACVTLIVYICGTWHLIIMTCFIAYWDWGQELSRVLGKADYYAVSSSLALPSTNCLLCLFFLIVSLLVLVVK